MPSPTDYRKILGCRTNGQVRKEQSDNIMNDTWWEDIQSRVVYLYDYYHDNHKTRLNNMRSDKDSDKTPVDAKFVMSSSQTYDKDAVTFHLQLRPGQKCNVNYYKEFFGDRYEATWPIGLFVDIPDEQGIYNRWLVVDKANYNVTQFPTFEILKCDKVFQWIIDNTKFECAGVLRSQNSYNSGIWTDLKIETIEDQQKFTVPLNRDTEKLYYNQRLIIDGAVLTEPRAWHITKINRIAPNGISRITLAQDHYDNTKDYIEVNSDGNVIGMWADYYTSSLEPTNYQKETTVSSSIGFSGANSDIKIGGSYKQYAINFEDGKYRTGKWEYYIREKETDSLIKFNDIIEKTDGLKNNEIKIHFGLDKDKNSNKTTEDYYEFIDWILTIKYVTDDGIETSLDVAIKSL